MNTLQVVAFWLLCVTLCACRPARSLATGADPAPRAEVPVQPALESISADDLLRHITRLASDGFEGRAPGTRGEDSTVAYLESEFRRLGLRPGHPDGSFVQQVPLVGLAQEVSASFEVRGTPWRLEGPREFLAGTRRVVSEVKVEDSEIVFVGYGVVAPEYGWDDYKGVDVRGKTILMLVNDPAIPDPREPGALDTSMFKGPAMTYYGRWTYKYEIATEKGAAAAFVVHETKPAGYPYAVVAGGWGRERFDIRAADDNMSRVPVQGWLPVESARRLFGESGMDFDVMKQAALSRDFRPVTLPATATVHIANRLREIRSRNVVAKLEGSNPERNDEYVVYTAHWDHLGRDQTRSGDQIFNGARDNASGTAALLELAEAYTRIPRPPDRSVLFLAVTAEEQGLLGSEYYAENPLYPLERTAANINMDGINVWGRTSDITVVGLGNSTLDDLLARAAATQGRTIRPDTEPEKGFYYRSDQFEFAKQGVPALFTRAGTRYLGRPEGYGQEKRDEYTDRDYHRVSDEIKADWDLSGALEDLRLLFLVGYWVAQERRLPEWKPGVEFKERRERVLRQGAVPPAR